MFLTCAITILEEMVPQDTKKLKFFSTTDPLKQTVSISTYPNWKIDLCLKHMVGVSKQCIHLELNISFDEQEMGFQGQYKDKQWISYKKVGDRFLTDVLSSDGCTQTWYFWNEKTQDS